MTPRSLRERVVHPRNVGGVPSRVLFGVESDTTKIVAATLDIQGRVGHPADGPAAVLDTGLEAWGRVGTAQAQRVRLHALMEPVLSERELVAEEELPLERETIERVEATVERTVAIRPVVVAGRKHGRRVQRVEEAKRF